MNIQLNAADALIIVDVQNDFCPGGRLPVEGGHDVVPELNRWIEAAERGGALVVASRDWHPSQHVSFQEQGGAWPEHCVQRSSGAEFHPQLKLPKLTVLVSKGEDIDKDNYSDFEATGLGDLLRRVNVRRVWVGGLAQDVCVRATTLDALAQGFETYLIEDATRPVELEAGDGARAIEEMRAAGAHLINTHA
jgi:nicotinamidase/pyrazinamidase